MGINKNLRGFLLGITIVALSVAAGLSNLPQPVSAAPSGAYFDHVVIIAMENTPYASVFGAGTPSTCPTGSAPFLCSMLSYSSTIPSMNNYGATSADSNDFNGCSAACYVGLMFGYTYGVSDGYSFSSVSGNPQFVKSLSSAGLTWQAYCAEGCPRGSDHFPFSGTNTFTSPSVTTSTFINAANSANPPNFLWYTPTDGENMHDVSVSTGDSYLQSFLVGSGSVTSPGTGSLLASNVFTNSNFRTMLYLWWDECGGNNGSCDGNNDAPNLFYGTTVKKGYVSSDSNGIDEYASLWTMENNWGISPIAQGDKAAQSSGYQFNDIFTNGGSGPGVLSATFAYSPTTLSANQSITFSATAQGGTGPYTYSWNFGDGSNAIGANPSHSYIRRGTYNVTMITTDSSGQTFTKSEQVTVGQTGTTGSWFSMLWLLGLGLAFGGGAGAVLYLRRYHRENRRLRDEINISSYNRNSRLGGKTYSDGKKHG